MSNTNVTSRVVGTIRSEVWTYDKIRQPKAVAVIAHRRGDGTFAPGRFGNGARR